MEIRILPSEKSLVTSHKGNEIVWSYFVWGNLIKETTHKIFGPTNDYLKTLPEETLDSLWDCYVEANDALLTIGANKSLGQDLTEIVNRISLLFEFEHLMNWAGDKGNIKPDVTIPAHNNTRNSDGMTLLRYEAYEISVFCVFVKLIAPIWGQYVNQIKNDVGNKHKERIACKIFLSSKFTETRPFIRIEEYLKELAANRSKKVNTALAHGLPVADLHVFLMGMTLIRRFCIIPLLNMDKVNIVAYVYQFLEDQIRDLMNSNYRDKFKNDSVNGQESDSYSDQWRVAQEVSDDVAVETEHYCASFPRLLRHQKLDGNDALNATKILEALRGNKRFIISEDIHLFLTALVFRHRISPPVIMHLCRDTRLKLIAITAAKAYKQGFKDIKDILLAVKKPADPHNMQMISQNGQKFQRLTQETDMRLNDCYPHNKPSYVNIGTNPGKITIEALVKELSSSIWLGLGDVADIRNSVANFIIQR